MKLVFVHGWGSGTFVWKEMIGYFNEYETHMINMGFVGEEKTDLPEGKFIGIGHSLGGLWLLKHYPERLSGFISIASFSCFHRYVPEQILAKMEKNIVQNTINQVTEFWHHAGLDQPDGFKNLNPLKLVEGLHWLSKWEASVPNNIPVKILASKDDQIVPEKMTHNVWKEYDIDWIDTGGHMLPLTQANWCTTHVKDFIGAIK